MPRRARMKKVIIPPDIITLLVQRHSFLHRADIQIFTADSNEEALDIHRQEKANLIIAHLSCQELSSRTFCSLVREDKELSGALIILICSQISSDIEESSQCKAHAVVTKPISEESLLEKARQLLDVSVRASYRVLLNVAVEGSVHDTAFFCRSEDISATGMLIETDQDLKKGNRVLCSFFLTTGPQIRVTAEVVRRLEGRRVPGTNRYGLKFTNLTSAVRRTLKEFIDTRISAQPSS